MLYLLEIKRKGIKEYFNSPKEAHRWVELQWELRGYEYSVTRVL